MAFLTVKHSISKARDSFGYNRVTLIDQDTRKRYATCGGGYDMLGTCLGDYLQSNHQTELHSLVCKAYQNRVIDINNGMPVIRQTFQGLYGLTYDCINNAMMLDGACGFDCMVKIAREAGLTVNLYHDKKGHLTSLFVG